MSTLRALIFDFDGVIANTEPLHFAGLHQTLKEIGIDLTEADYYANYLGYDDHGCFVAALTAHHRPVDSGTIAQLMKRKACGLSRVRQASSGHLSGRSGIHT